MLSWFDASDNELVFELQRESRHPKNGKWVGSTILNAPENSESLTDQSGTGTFRYQIRATNGYGSSSWVGPIEVTVTDTTTGSSSGGGNTKGGGRGKK